MYFRDRRILAPAGLACGQPRAGPIARIPCSAVKDSAANQPRRRNLPINPRKHRFPVIPQESAFRSRDSEPEGEKKQPNGWRMARSFQDDLVQVLTWFARGELTI